MMPDAAVPAAADIGGARTDPHKPFAFEAHVDFYGPSPLARGWFVGGWMAYPWPDGQRPANAVARFTGSARCEHLHSVFFQRDDVAGRGIGYVLFLRSHGDLEGTLVSMQIDCAGGTYTFHPTPTVARLNEQQLREHLLTRLEGGDEGSHEKEMHMLLLGQAPEAVTGYVDYHGYHEAAAGWLFAGWIGVGWEAGKPPSRAVVTFGDGELRGEAHAVLYPRADLDPRAEGLVLFVRGPATLAGTLESVAFDAGGVRAKLGAAATRLRETELTARLRPVLAQAAADPNRETIAGLLSREAYRGEDTLHDLDTPVLMEIDEAIAAGPDGLVLIGWCLCHPDEIQAIRVRGGRMVAVLDLDDAIRTDRPDVLETHSGHGFDDPRCGFIAFVPHAVSPDARIYIEVESKRHRIGYRNVPRPKLGGLAAIKRLLGAVDVRYSEVRHAYDNVLGPAVQGLNRQRLAVRPGMDVIQHGPQPADPRHSVIVPLHGRLDFVEYQMALFGAHPDLDSTEFIYVLDDPPRRREAHALFASVFERFQVPFTALLLDRNVGFAPASNIGLDQARGTYVAFLNSDVFPGTLDWLDRLASRIGQDPATGIVGPLLVFEDGAVQHRGMFFRRVPEFGDWWFGTHHDKGLRFKGARTPQSHLGITGACMVMRRDLAVQVGGFDEAYVIGDFEDSDLCFRVQALGYVCVVDPAVELVHLERKSQAGSGVGWRMGLTVYNAWQHDRRWGSTIAIAQSQ